MDKRPYYVSMTISLESEKIRLSEKILHVLSRWLKREPGDIRRSLETKKIRINKALLTDDLQKVVAVLAQNGLHVEIAAAQNDATTRTRFETSLGTTGRVFTPRTGHQTQTDWNKGDVIEGLYEVFGSAAGGMGKVYFVFHRLWKMMLAIKTPLARSVQSEARMRRFLREAELWVNLGLHPNIATCYYARIIDGLPRLFIEYVDGGTLDEWNERGLLKDLRTVGDLMLQFCHGMMYAEQKGIIHRDIKPANCLIASDRTLKVTDFGLVKRVTDQTLLAGLDDAPIEAPATDDADRNLTLFEGGVVGSPWYMAPERFKEESREDIRSDLYSFGVMLYEITVRSMPFRFPNGFSLVGLVKSQLRVPPIDPLSVNPDLPRSLVRIIMTCLEKKPENRYPSFVDVCAELEAFNRELRPGREPRSRPNLVALKADSLNNQAVSLLDLGRDQEARVLLDDAHSANNEHLEAVYNLHTLRWQNSEISDREVINHLESLKIEVRESADYAHYMGLVALQRGEAARAVTLLERAMDLGTYYRERWHAMGTDPRSFVKSLGFIGVGEEGSLAGHIKRVLSVAFAPGSLRAFSVGEDRSIRIWDGETGRCLKNLRTFTFVPVAAAFSQDGRLAVTAYGVAFKTIDLWDLEKGQAACRYSGMAVLGANFSPDSRHIAAFGPDGRVRVLETGIDKISWEFQDLAGGITTISFIEDSESLVLGREDGTVSVRRLRYEMERFRVPVHRGAVRIVRTSLDGSKILTAGSDEAVRLLDAVSGTEIRRFLGHRGPVTDARFTPDEKYVVSASTDGTLKIWDAASGRCYRTLVLSGEEFTCSAISADGRSLLSGGAKGSVCRWLMDTRWYGANFLEPAVCRPKTFEELATLYDAFKQAVEDFHDVLARNDLPRGLEIFERIRSMPGFCWSTEAIGIRNTLSKVATRGRLRGSSFVRSFLGHQDAVVVIDAGTDSLTLLTGSMDGSAILWDVVTGRSLKRFQVSSPVREARFLSRSSRILIWSEDAVLRIWNMSGDLVTEIPDVARPIRVLDGGAEVAAVSLDNTPLRIDPETGHGKARGASIQGSEFLCYSSGAEMLFSLKDGKRILRWSADTGRNEGAFRDLGHTITAVLPIASTGEVLAGAESGEVLVYRGGTGVNLITLRGHTGAVRALASTEDGDLWVSGSDDCSLRLWQSTSEDCLAVLEGHGSPVRTVGFFPNISMAASGSADGSVRLWGLEWEVSAAGSPDAG